MKNVQLK